MKTSKIEDITGIREWQGDKGTVYYFQLLMDNGDKGSIGKKSREALKVGDSLTYTLEESEKGNKIKEFNQNGYGGGGGFKKSATGSNASFALSYSKDLSIALINKGQDISSDQVLAVAGKFKKWLDENQ